MSTVCLISSADQYKDYIVMVQASVGNQFKIGSGAIYGDSHVITSRHVIEDAKKVYITQWTGAKYECRFVKFIPNRDIAIFKILHHNIRSPLKLSDQQPKKSQPLHFYSYRHNFSNDPPQITTRYIDYNSGYATTNNIGQKKDSGAIFVDDDGIIYGVLHGRLGKNDIISNISHKKPQPISKSLFKVN